MIAVRVPGLAVSDTRSSRFFSPMLKLTSRTSRPPVRAATSWRRTRMPPVKTRSTLPIVTTSPSASTAEPTRIPLTKVPLMLWASRISVPTGVAIKNAWWREASTSWTTTSLSSERPIQAAPVTGASRFPDPRVLTLVVGNSAISPLTPIWVGGFSSSVGPGGGTIGMAVVRGVSSRGGGPGGRGAGLLGRTGRGPLGATIVGIVSVGGSSPTVPWCCPTWNVISGPSGLPMLTLWPSWMSTVGTRRPLRKTPFSEWLSTAIHRPLSKRSSRCARATSGCATRRSARTSLPTTTSRPGAKLPSHR
jgi:hypothetical protein